MKIVTVSEFKARLSEHLHFVEKEEIVVTRYGKPKAIIRHFTGDEMEDYVITHHPDLRASLEESYQEFLEGKVIDLDTLIQETEKEIEDAGI